MFSYDPFFMRYGRTIITLLALAGLGYLLFQLLGAGDQRARLSLWGAQGAGAAAQPAVVVAAPAAGLSGVAQPTGRGLAGDERPQGNPLQSANIVLTQGYGVGSHAPAETWGGVDLAIDGDGDGAADPQGTMDHPIYATHSGVVRLTPNSWPGGNHIWVENEQYRTGFAHLARFAVEHSQTVQRGDLIGYVGTTGMSSGPHLHYDAWVNEGGSWVNVNPLEYGALDGGR
jgi:murein DD-endopeptidase MepM/ murein hydrolase activator NlpD